MIVELNEEQLKKLSLIEGRTIKSARIIDNNILQIGGPNDWMCVNWQEAFSNDNYAPLLKALK